VARQCVEVIDVYWSAGYVAGVSVPIGRAYLDMHPREHKYKHAAQFTVCDGVEGVQRPEGALVTNLPSEGPMEFGQVVTHGSHTVPALSTA
jgi:thimet oligopeptidase